MFSITHCVPFSALQSQQILLLPSTVHRKLAVAACLYTLCLLDHFSLFRESLIMPVKQHLLLMLVDVSALAEPCQYNIDKQHALPGRSCHAIRNLVEYLKIIRLPGRKAIFVYFLLTIFSISVTLVIFTPLQSCIFTGLAVSLSAQQQSPLYF